MSLPLNEVDEVRRIQIGLLSEIEQLAHIRGSYRYVCFCGGGLLLSHKPCGRVVRYLT